MKNLKLKKLGVLFVLILALGACEKESEQCDPNDEESACYSGPSGTSKGDILLLSEHKVNGKLIAKYEYNKQNKMTKYYVYELDGSAIQTTISYLYNDKGLLTTANFTNQKGEITLKEEYTYGSGNLPVSMVQTMPTSPDPIPVDFQFTFKNNLLTSETAIPRHEDVSVNTYGYTYNSDGNLASIEYKQNGKWYSTLEFGDYDEMIFIAKHGNPYFWKGGNSSPNNAKTEKMTSNISVGNFDRYVQHTYNVAGYPVKSEVYDRGTKKLVEVREYSYVRAK